MKKICRALCALFITACVLRAADKDDQDSPLGDFMPTFDDLIEYVPKFTVKLGFRALTGVKSSFGGQGVLSDASVIGDTTGANGTHVYHDGYVLPDGRTTEGDITGPIVPDGLTNTWHYVDNAQWIQDGDLMTMHAYSVTNTDAAFHSKNPGMSLGVELEGQRDFGKLFGTRMQWGVVGGMSVNQISVHAERELAAEVTTTTDYYSLDGQTPPGGGYTAPSASTSGDVLLGNTVLFRQTTTSTATLINAQKLRGAYLTFRAGPTVHMPITEKLSANMSAGAVLLYVGTTYEVTQRFLPETGDEMVSAIRDGASGFLPGFYVDADVQYALTDTTGFYAGGVYQTAGTYSQTIHSDDGTSNYSTKIDFGSMQALRAGFLFRF